MTVACQRAGSSACSDASNDRNKPSVYRIDAEPEFLEGDPDFADTVDNPFAARTLTGAFFADPKIQPRDNLRWQQHASAATRNVHKW